MKPFSKPIILKAFTIVELLIVIVVIGILVTISVLTYTGVSSRANVATIQSDLDSNSRKLQLYYSLYNSYPTALDANSCPLTPTATTNPTYCLRYTGSNTLSNYTGTINTFSLNIANGSLVWKVTESTPPASATTFNLTLNTSSGGTATGSNTYETGSVVTITATPNTNYSFTSWTGDTGCSGAASHTITITANTTCTASFSFSLGTATNPATSATAIKTANSSATTGVYHYKFADNSVKAMWTDFSSYAPYKFVVVNRISSTSQNQLSTSEDNVSDLSTDPATASPSRNSKLSDVHMNEIISNGTVRWAIVGGYGTFYRLDDSPQWYSNHGTSQSCGYTIGFYDAYANPSSSPTWQTTFGSYQACGGAIDSSGNWMSLTGIHVGDGTYFGGYSGSSAYRSIKPAGYNTGSSSDNSWSMSGYVLLSW